MPVSIEDYNEHDQQIWEEELSDFVPDQLFDTHIHMLAPEHLPEEKRIWGKAELKDLQKWANRLYPGREVNFLTLGTPLPGIDVQAHNSWFAEQIKQDPSSRWNRLVTPDCTPEEIEKDFQTGQMLGLKPYRVFSSTGDIQQCRIHEFLTHEQMELANHYGMWVTMHLSRYHGCADEANLIDLTEYTQRRYPNIKWILAHCARSFTYWPIREAIDQLNDLPNIWYDLSAVCDIRPVLTLFQKEDHRRIFYGSDGIDATYFHGSYIALGRAWQGFDITKQSIQFPHCDGRPILCIYEQLLAMKQAAEIAGFTKDQLKDIFRNNAVREFGIDC